MNERLARVVSAIQEAGATWAILTKPCSVFYATGHIVPVEAGPSPFAGGPTTAFISREGECMVVCANVEVAPSKERWAQVHPYEGFAFEHSVDYEANYLDTISSLRKKHGIGGFIAAETSTIPHAMFSVLEITSLQNITPYLQRARATKTDGEKEALRKSAHAAAVGQRTFYTATRPGRSELDVFSEIRCAIETFAGERVPVTGDFVSGRERTAATGGWPNRRMIEAGDAVMSDLAPRVGGYWGDSCATAMVGNPTREFLSLFDAAKTALDHAVSIMRPGLSISQLDAELRDIVAKAGYAYPHHSGHSIGTAVHEWPRIVPYETEALKEGMFLMVEPGAYDPEIGGVRTEWMIEVTGSGCRPVAPFDHLPGIATI